MITLYSLVCHNPVFSIVELWWIVAIACTNLWSTLYRTPVHILCCYYQTKNLFLFIFFIVMCVHFIFLFTLVLHDILSSNILLILDILLKFGFLESILLNLIFWNLSSLMVELGLSLGRVNYKLPIQPTNTPYNSHALFLALASLMKI